MILTIRASLKLQMGFLQVRTGQVRLGWVRLGWVRMGQAGLSWVRLVQVGLGSQVWLGQVGLGWNGLDSARIQFFSSTLLSLKASAKCYSNFGRFVFLQFNVFVSRCFRVKRLCFQSFLYFNFTFLGDPDMFIARFGC